MKKILSILFVFCVYASQAQLQEFKGFGESHENVRIRGALLLPTGCGEPSPLNSRLLTYGQGAIYTDSCGNQLYFWNPSTNSWSNVSGAVLQDGRLSGAEVTWTGDSTAFFVPAGTFRKFGEFYTTNDTTIILDRPNDLYGRIDLIVFDTTNGGEIRKVTGELSPTPIEPQVADYQIKLTTGIAFSAGSTTPSNVSVSVIYDENTEWTAGHTGTMTVNFNNTSTVYHGSKSAYISSYSKNSALTFGGTAIDVTTDGVLSLWINLTGSFSKSFTFQLWNNTIAASNSISVSNTYGFDPNYIGWQNIAIPLSAFSWTSQTFNKATITITGNGNFSGQPPFYLDYMQVQKGLTNSTPPATDYSGKLDAVSVTKTTDANDTIHTIKEVVKGIETQVGEIRTPQPITLKAAGIVHIDSLENRVYQLSVNTDTLASKRIYFGYKAPTSVGFDAGIQLYGSGAGSTSIYQYRVGAAPSIVMGRSNGTVDNPTLVTSGQEFGRLKIGSTNGVTFYDASMMSSWATQDWTTTNRPYETKIYTAPNGSAFAVPRIVIGNDGNIQFNAYQKTPAVRSQAYQNLGVDASGNVVRTDMSEMGVSVKAFGATGDGLTDDWYYINQAYLFLKSIGGGTLRFPGPAIYKVNTTILIDTSNIHIQIDPSATVLRGSLSGSDPSDGYSAVFTFAGSETLAVTTATAPIPAGSSTITVASADSLKTGDHIRVYSDQNFSYARTYYTNSYITKILGKSGNTLTIQPMSIDFDTLSPKMFAVDIWAGKTYQIIDRVKTGETDTTNYVSLGSANNNTGTRFLSTIDSDTLTGSGSVRQVSTIYISKLKPLTNISIFGGGRINGNNYVNGQTGSVVGVYMKNTVNASVKNIEIDSVKGYATYIKNSLNPQFSDNKIIGATDSVTTDWGVYFDQCVNYSANNNTIKTGWSGIDATSSFIGSISNNTLDLSRIDPHSGKFISVTNNKIQNASITIRVDNSKFIGNTITWNRQVDVVDQGIILTEAATNGNVDIENNTVSFTYPVPLLNITVGIYSQTGNISKNKRCHRFFSNWNISNNTINGATRGIDISVGNTVQAGVLPTKVTVSGNIVKGYRQFGILSSFLSNSELSNNRAYLDSAFANSIQKSVIDSSYLVGITPDISSQGRFAVSLPQSYSWYLPPNISASTYSNWKMQPNIPIGISMVGNSTKRNSNIQLTGNITEGTGNWAFFVSNTDTFSISRTRILNNSVGFVNGTTYTKNQTWTDSAFQQLENQRLSTTNNVKFNTITALNNGGIGYAGQNYAGYSFGTNGYAAVDTKLNTYLGTNILFQVNSVTKGSMDSNGSLSMSQYKLSALNTAPASATATGTTGEIRITAGYIYVCIATNTWVRSALATW